MTLETLPWDPADHLRTEEDIVAYLEAVMEEGDPDLIGAALGDVARARGLGEVARLSGLSPERLAAITSREEEPEFGTVLLLIRALGLRMTVSPAHAQA